MYNDEMIETFSIPKLVRLKGVRQLPTKKVIYVFSIPKLVRLKALLVVCLTFTIAFSIPKLVRLKAVVTAKNNYSFSMK